MISVVTEIEMPGCRLLRHIEFDLDDNRKTTISGFHWCYRSRTSSNAFFHGRKRRPNKSKTRLYTCLSKSEFDFSQKIREDIHSRFFFAKGPEVPYVRVKNIWEFYELIGYDYKKKNILIKSDVVCGDCSGRTITSILSIVNYILNKTIMGDNK